MPATSPDVLGSLVIWCAAANAFVQLLDWLLPAKLVIALSDVLLGIWHWLAEQRLGRFLRALHNPRVVRWLLLALCIAPLVLIASVVAVDISDGPQPLGVPEAIIVVYGVLPGVVIAFLALAMAAHSRLSRLVGWVVAKRSPASTVLRIAALCALGFVSLVLFERVLVLTAASRSGLEDVMAGAILGLLGGPTLVMTFMTLTALTWLLALGALALLLTVTEFLVRRLVENPKGPMLGASALLGALGVLLKSLA
jgi:hypothetical protein